MWLSDNWETLPKASSKISIIDLFLKLTLNKLDSYPRSTPKPIVAASAPTRARPMRASKTALIGVCLVVGILSRFFSYLFYIMYTGTFLVYANLVRLVNSLDMDNLNKCAANNTKFIFYFLFFFQNLGVCEWGGGNWWGNEGWLYFEDKKQTNKFIDLFAHKLYMCDVNNLLLHYKYRRIDRDVLKHFFFLNSSVFYFLFLDVFQSSTLSKKWGQTRPMFL